MIKPKEEEGQINRLKLAQLIYDRDRPTEKKDQKARETLIERCQRILADRIPVRFKEIKSQFEEDLQMSKIGIVILSALCYQIWISYLMKWKLSGLYFLYCISSCFCVCYLRMILRRRLKDDFTYKSMRYPSCIKKKIDALQILSYCTDLLTVSSTDYVGATMSFLSKILLSYQFLMQKKEKIFQKNIFFPKLIWIFLRLALLIMFGYIWPTIFSFGNEMTVLFSFIFISELYGCICAGMECLTAGIKHVSQEFKFSFILSQIRYSEITKLAIIFLYQNSTTISIPLLLFVTVLQSSICWWLKRKLKPVFIFLKEAKHFQGTQFILKYRVNQLIKTNLNQKFDSNRQKYCNQKSDFDDELCFFCAQRKADVANSICLHVCFCSVCFESKMRKNRNNPDLKMRCPICNATIRIFFKLRQKNVICCFREIFRKDEQPFVMYKRYDYQIDQI